MAARRVAGEDEPLREAARVRDGEQDVMERAGPATTRIADAAVFDVSRRDSRAAQGLTEMAGVDQVVRCLPRPAVEHQSERIRARPPQIAELQRLASVRDSLVRRWRRWVREDVCGDPDHLASID